MENDRKVIALTRSHLPTGDTPEAVVNLLTGLLDKAKRGELLGLTAAWVEGNNDVGFQIAHGAAPASVLVAAVSALDHEIKSRWAGK